MPEIAAVLEAEIAGLPNGTKLPSEHELMGRFGVTRSTVRRAIEQLEARFLVRRVHGSGTFVNRRVDYLISSRLAPSLHATIERAGSVARTFVVDVSEAPLPADIAERFGIAEGTGCMRLVRVGYIDDHPATAAEEWIAPGVADHVDVSLRAIESLTEVLRGAHRVPTRAWSRASTAFPPEEVRERLDLSATTPTWRVETLTRDGMRGDALMYSRASMRQDRIRVVIEFEATSEPAASA